MALQVENSAHSIRPWGSFQKFTENEMTTVKIIDVEPRKMLSYQYHEKRSEYWKVVTGDAVAILDERVIRLLKDSELFVPQGAKHRLIGGAEGARILEISFGDFDEGDIVRIEDEYGRVGTR